jgi:hypothetical protein
MVSRTRYALPLSAPLAHKFDALEAVLDVHVLAASAGVRAPDPRFRLVRRMRPGALDGPLFYALLPLRVARELQRSRPDAMLVQGGQETALAFLGRARYGSPLRKALAPLGYLLARQALQRADGVRTLSDFTSSCAKRDASRRRRSPRSSTPSRSSWPGAASGASRCALRRRARALQGRGRPGGGVASSGAEPARRRAPPRGQRAAGQHRRRPRRRAAGPDEVDGTPPRGCRRARARRGNRARAPIPLAPDLAEDGENGLLVPEENAAALAGALVRVLGDRVLAERLGEAASNHVEAWLTTPEEYARRVRDLVEDVVTARPVGRRSYVPRRAPRPTTSLVSARDQLRFRAVLSRPTS